MKILITGAGGQLGYHLQEALPEHELFLGDVENYDITKRDVVLKQTEEFAPQLIIHAGAYTNVDGAQANKELCRAINVDGSRNVALAAKLVGAPIVAISTDYVFAGNGNSPYSEKDEPNPVSYYGQTKLDGETAIKEITDQYFICRTAWLYGGPQPDADTNFSSSKIKNFVYTMLRVGRERAEVEVVSDQVGSPTYAKDLAQTIKKLSATGLYGTYHITNRGQTDWANFAQAIFNLAQYKTKVLPIRTKEWEQKNPAATKRPAYSVLGHNALLEAGLTDLRDWQEALTDFLGEYSLNSFQDKFGAVPHEPSARTG